MKNIAITENHLYKKAYAGGKKAGGRYTVMYVLKDKKAYVLRKANPQKEYINRIGITVSKKIGGAVQRNRAKRVIRAAFAGAEKEMPIKKGFLIVIAAREAAIEAKSSDILVEMKKQLDKLGMTDGAYECLIHAAGSTRGQKTAPHSAENDISAVTGSAGSTCGQTVLPHGVENDVCAVMGSMEISQNGEKTV
jgi:ribonuclease P protein component